MASSISLPGQPLGPTTANRAGNGTHIQQNHLYSSLAGSLVSTPSTTKSVKQPTISVTRADGAQLPDTNRTVLGRVTRTGPKQANISIIALGADGAHVCAGEGFPAIIRQQDIRATEIDKAKVGESFKVGDVVRAVVISLGDERAYYCSTAKDELGVVLATSEWGNQMHPVSWREFVDPVTGGKELRKVAKPV